MTTTDNQSTEIYSSAFNDWITKPKSIIISIIILFLLTSCVFFFLIYWQNRNSRSYLVSTDKNNAASIASVVAEHNKKVLEALTIDVQKQQIINAAKRINIAGAQEQLALLKKNIDFDRAIITDNNGIVRANFPASSVGSILSYRDWYKGVRANWQPNVSGVFQVTTGDKPLVVAFSVPIFDEKRNPIGILTIYEKIGSLAASLKSKSLDESININLTDQTGNIIFDNKSDFQKKITVHSLFPLIQKALSENKTQVEIINSQTKQQTGYLSLAKVEGTGWLSIVRRDLQSNLDANQTKNPTAIIVVLSLIFIILSLALIYLRKIIILEIANRQLLSAAKLFEGEKKKWEIKSPVEKKVSNSNIPLIVWDNDLIIVRFDREFEEMTGWTKEEVLGKKVDVLLPEKSKKESLNRIKTVSKTEVPSVLDVPILDSEGNTTITRGQYITARKQMDMDINILAGKLEKRVLERTANLEAANRQLEAFSHSISYALLSPLQTIEKLCSALKEDYQGKTEETKKNYLAPNDLVFVLKGKTEETKKNYLEQIYKEIKRMRQLIDDMQKLSRLNRTVINRQTVDLSRIVGETMEAYKQKFPDRDVAVTVEKDIFIDGDEILIRIAIENLIDNAWKFTATKERATIKFGTTLKDGKTVMFIRDNGSGFDMAHINKLFNAFHQVGTNSDSPDTGIGLATVQRIVVRHGGEIWAESKPEKGATFYFTLS